MYFSDGERERVNRSEGDPTVAPATIIAPAMISPTTKSYRVRIMIGLYVLTLGFTTGAIICRRIKCTFLDYMYFVTVLLINNVV